MLTLAGVVEREGVASEPVERGDGGGHLGGGDNVADVQKMQMADQSLAGGHADAVKAAELKHENVQQNLKFEILVSYFEKEDFRLEETASTVLSPYQDENVQGDCDLMIQFGEDEDHLTDGGGVSSPAKGKRIHFLQEEEVKGRKPKKQKSLKTVGEEGQWTVMLEECCNGNVNKLPQK